MSDTPTAAEQLASRVRTSDSTFTFGDDFLPGEQLTIEQATRIIAERLPSLKHPDRGFTAFGRQNADEFQANQKPWRTANIAQKLAMMIPPDKLTEDVVRNGDLRTLLFQVMTTEYAAETRNESVTVNGVEFTPDERIAAGSMLVDLSEETETQIQEMLLGAAPMPTDEIQQASTMEAARLAAQELNAQFRDGKMIRVSNAGQTSVDPVSGQASGSQVPNEFLDLLGSGNQERRTPTRFLNANELRRLISTGEMSFEDVRQLGRDGGYDIDPRTGEPTAFLEADPGVVYSNQMTERGPAATTPDGRPAYTGDPRWQDENERRGKDWYTLSEVNRLPSTMSRVELIALDEKLRAAGIYERIGVEPTLPGDFTDPTFKRAWSEVVQMAMEKNVSMDSLLARRTMQIEKMRNAASAVYLTDPARHRLSADALARDRIGRALNDDEHRELGEFLRALEIRNAQMKMDAETGAANTMDAGQPGEQISDPMSTEYGSDPRVVADLDAQMEMWIRDENAEEYEAASTADQYAAFSRMLAGPGRGVQ